MKKTRVVTLVLATLLAVITTLTAQETWPVVSAETGEGALECEGNGLIKIVADECMHDGGRSASGDSLEVYCYQGIARFCLSGEACHWREPPAGPRDETCSRAGLGDEWMATSSCDGWSGFHDFACTERGQIKLRKEGRADIPQSCGAAD